MRPRRPVLRYHGGKFRLAPWVLQHFPPHRIYVEPFGGAGSLLMQKWPCYAEVYNDLDGDIVNVFRVLRDPSRAARLRELLELTPFARAEFDLSYEIADDPIERARRTVARCYMAHGSTSRRRNRTGFRARNFLRNGAAGSDWVNYPQHIVSFVERLQGVVIECRPAIEVIEQQDGPQTLFYVDPPYVQVTRSSLRTPSEADRAYRHDLTDDDHRDLAGILRQVEGMVVLSGYPSALYDELYRRWRCEKLEVFADGAQPRVECIWLNAACSDALQVQLRLL